MSSVIVFDDGKGQLAPLTDLRPAFDIRTGAYTTLQRLERNWPDAVTGLLVPPHLAAITRERHRYPVNDQIQVADQTIFVSGRCPLWDSPSPPTLPPGCAIVEEGSGDLVAACLGRADAERFIRGEPVQFTPHGNPLARALISRPWHVRTFRDAALRLDVGALAAVKADPAPAGVVVTHDRGLKIAGSARVYPSVVLDTEPGPIVIDDHAVVRPGAIITGPAYIGPHSTVLDRAVIRPNTAIGPYCKVAGEVSGTIFQGYANKAHDGFLGDSYVGEWANLGAGTTNSNLLNTYGEVPVRSRPDGPMERTGETFMGCIIGDHAKFAICTRIMTGAVIHTGAMYAATAPVSGCIHPFAWITDEGKRTYRLDKFTEVARTVMARRNVTPSAAYLARLAELHRIAVGG